tara:strand:- start:1265 stop:1507 length:243 start_codon:yes stop_codon:yes gene_type:complete
MQTENNLKPSKEVNEILIKATRDLFSIVSPDELKEDLNNLFSGYLNSELADNKQERIKILQSIKGLTNFIELSDSALKEN